MEIIKAYATWSECYKAGKTISPSGIVVHSTGANNPNLKRYVNSPAQLGENIYKNYWGTGTVEEQEKNGIPHAAIGKDKSGKVALAQVLPFNMRCWGCGPGKNGSYNDTHIQFEICEDGLTDKSYFEAAFDLAAQFCAELMQTYPSIKLENIVSHKEACARGYASNHGDPENWLSKFGKDMNWFRDKVKSYGTVSTTSGTASAKFSPRLTAPSAADKHWIKSTKGGLNDCIEINGGSVLPNCVGYAWGRFYEIIGEKPKLSKNNAEMWYGNTADGYKRSQIPALGAVICWSKGVVGNEADGAGHVAIVEQILSNGDIVTSNSAYGGSRFYTTTVKKSDGYNFGAYKFQGFILPPTTASTPTALKVGDTVNFTGTTHYAGSTATRGTACKPGKAKITRIVDGAAHPIHLVNEGGGCTVYGWVNAEDVQG
ncbi:MAG: CHAP domain-containing protein [Ruminococcaceae bacterium]|nr:CHAP domain-containing protein [Oscillospiraceae bacterium]